MIVASISGDLTLGCGIQLLSLFIVLFDYSCYTLNNNFCCMSSDDDIGLGFVDLAVGVD